MSSCRDTRASVFLREARAVNMRRFEGSRACMHVPRHVCVTYNQTWTRMHIHYYGLFVPCRSDLKTVTLSYRLHLCLMLLGVGLDLFEMSVELIT